MDQIEQRDAATLELAGDRDNEPKVRLDEPMQVMYVAADPASACAIALDLAEGFSSHAVLPPVRAGVDSGDVLARDGDYFGDVVNVAARIVKEAAPGAVVVTARALPKGFSGRPLGRRPLKGLDASVELFELRVGSP